MGSLLVVLFDPLVQVSLQFFDRLIELFPKGHPVKFVEHREMEMGSDITIGSAKKPHHVFLYFN